MTSPIPVTTTITTDLFDRVSYTRQGHGPAILLLHGFPASGNLFSKITSVLREYFTVIVPDIPGSGDSGAVTPDLSITDLATIVPAILDDAGIEQCVLAGHSMGGYIAIGAAKFYPDRVAGLSLIHSTARADDAEKIEKRRKSAALIASGGAEPFIRQMIPALFSAHFRDKHPEIIGEWIVAGMKISSDSMIAFTAAMGARADEETTIKTAPFPVQWIGGDDDTIIPITAILQQSALAAVSYVSVFNTCGHMSMIEAPEKLTTDLRIFAAYCLNNRILEETTT